MGIRGNKSPVNQTNLVKTNSITGYSIKNQSRGNSAVNRNRIQAAGGGINFYENQGGNSV